MHGALLRLWPLSANCFGDYYTRTGLDLKTRELLTFAMQHKASQGEYTGGAAPYGHALAADGVALVEVESEQAVIAEARALRATGLSLRKIVEALDRKGFRARNGRTFAPAQVARRVAG